MPQKVNLDKNFSTENVLVETDQNIKDLYEAMVAKFGENNVTIEGEGDTKKLIVIDGEKKLAFSASSVPEAEQATENNDSINTAGLVQEVTPNESAGEVTQSTDEVVINADLADEQLDKLAESEKELGEVNAQIAETEDFSQLSDLRNKRNELEDRIINCSKYLNNCGKQFNFSSNEGNMKYYTENGVNFSEDNKVIGFSYCDKDYFFSDEDEATITVVDVDGNPTVLNKEDVVAAMQNQNVEIAEAEANDADAEADAIEDAENLKLNESSKCDQSFNDGQAVNEISAGMAEATDMKKLNDIRNRSKSKVNSSEIEEGAEAAEAKNTSIPYGQPIDVDSENPYDVNPELFYVIGLNDHGTETTEDDEIDVEIGIGFLTEEEAIDEANNVTPGENETIVVMKGAELIDKYDEMFDAIADAEMATDQNMSEMMCDPETGECVAVKADKATVPVVVNDVNNLAVTDLECGDKCISPFGNECVITKNVEPNDEIVQVSVPDDGVVVEVPVEDFSRDFSVIVSARTLVNFSNQVRQDIVKNFDEGSEVATSDEDTEVNDESDSFVPVEDEVVQENVEKSESEKSEAEKDADDAKNTDNGAKPATVSEVEAIVEEQIENKKPEIITEAASKTVEAIAPALQSQSQGMPQGADQGGEEVPPTEGEAPAEVGEQPVEGEGGESGEQVNQSEMVNHSEFFQNSAPQKQVNFSNDYARSLAGCFRRGKQAS